LALSHTNSLLISISNTSS